MNGILKNSSCSNEARAKKQKTQAIAAHLENLYNSANLRKLYKEYFEEVKEVKGNSNKAIVASALAAQIVNAAVEWPFIVQSELVEKNEDQENDEGSGPDDVKRPSGKRPRSESPEQEEINNMIDAALKRQKALKSKLEVARRVGNQGKTVHFDASVL